MNIGCTSYMILQLSSQFTFLNLRDKGSVPSQYVHVCFCHMIHLSQQLIFSETAYVNLAIGCHPEIYFQSLIFTNTNIATLQILEVELSQTLVHGYVTVYNPAFWAIFYSVLVSEWYFFILSIGIDFFFYITLHCM